MAGDPTAENVRVSVSLSQLRAELTSLELRLVDRLNGALANKADRAIVEQHTQRIVDIGIRLQSLEVAAIKRDGPIAQKIGKMENDLTALQQRAVTQDSPLIEEIEELRQANISLAEVGKYKRWLWAQTVALAGVSVGIIAFFIDHATVGG